MEGETDYIASNSEDVRAARVALLAVARLHALSNVQAAARSGARVHKAKDEVLNLSSLLASFLNLAQPFSTLLLHISPEKSHG